MNWFRACASVPPNSEKCLVSLRGIYHLAYYDASAGVFRLENDNAPLQVQPSDPELYWAPIVSGNTGLSLLVVDDDPDDVKDLVTTVRHIDPGITISVAHNGSEAIRYLSPTEPAGKLPGIILLDLFMPETDGFHVLESVRSRPDLDGTEVYVLSSSYSVHDWKRAKELGATAVVHKNHAKVELARILTYREPPERLERKRNFI